MFSEVVEDDDEENISWENLKTIKTFDGLDTSDRWNYGTENQNTTATTSARLLNGNMSFIPAKASTPVSLLIESLVQQLCSMLEPDKNISSKLYSSICEKFYQMNLIDETFAMGEFETMRSQYQRALYQLVSVARGQELPGILQNVWPLTQPVGMDWSRYFREFEEISYLAGGGFGKVYRARHKLDGIVYAIKKITIKSTTINTVLNHLSEVKTLASLNHVNIVPYKAAWLEPLIADNNTTLVDSSSEEEDDDEPEADDEPELESTRDSCDFIEFRSESNNASDDDKHPPYLSDESVDTNRSASTHHSRMVAKYQKNYNKISVNKNQPHLKLKWATLYIQMTLCQLNLREWLDLRNKYENFDDFYFQFVKDKSNLEKYCLNPSCKGLSGEDSDSGMETENPTHNNVVSNIFMQLLNGLHYIHSRGIVHHDIKPSNIFVALENCGKMIIQLGDFGLACPLQNTPSSHSKHGIGTPLYAAPEQLNGECNLKSDIYSLGIILLELLLPFNTDMERVDSIKKIRIGRYPENLNSSYANLVRRLLQNCHKRPNTFQLVELMNRMNSTKDNVIIELQRRLSEQEVEIQTLKSQLNGSDTNVVNSASNSFEDEQQEEKFLEILKTKDNEIKELKSRIEELEDRDAIELKSKDDEIIRLKKLLKDNKLLSDDR